MTEQHNDNRAVAILKPQYLLGLALTGLALAIVGAFQPQLGIMGFAGLGIFGLSVVTWGVIAPEQLHAVITGRTARYGGAAFVVTAVLLTALVAVYVLVRGLNLTFDVTTRDAFSVRPEIRESLVRIVGNPDTPNLRLMIFLTAEDVALRDRLILLMEDIQSTTLGKVSYEFIDIDQQPLLAQEYGIQGSQQIAVTPLDDEGNLQPSLANIIPEIDTAKLQADLVSYIITQNLQGSFSAYFVVEDGSIRVDATDGSGMTFLNDDLRTVFRFSAVAQGAMSNYRQSTDIKLNDPALDGETMVIAGGSTVLSEEDRLFLEDYLNNGGSLVLMAGYNLDGVPTLASDPELTAYLLDTFGIAFNQDFVIDTAIAYQGSDLIAPNVINTQHFIGQMSVDENSSVKFIFGFPTATIQTADETPTDVTITPLILTTQTAYSIATSELPSLVGSTVVPEIDQAVNTGAMIITATAENQTTGSRLVLIGNDTVAVDNLTDVNVGKQLGIANRELMLRSILWASNFDSRITNLERPAVVERSSEQPLIARDDQISAVNAILGLALPFAVLGFGALVVFLSRERESE